MIWVTNVGVGSVFFCAVIVIDEVKAAAADLLVKHFGALIQPPSWNTESHRSQKFLFKAERLLVLGLAKTEKPAVKWRKRECCVKLHRHRLRRTGNYEAGLQSNCRKRKKNKPAKKGFNRFSYRITYVFAIYHYNIWHIIVIWIYIHLLYFTLMISVSIMGKSPSFKILH